MKILLIGDIVASPGRKVVEQILPELKKEHEIDYVIANAENIAHGRGISEETLNEMLNCGVDFFTGGDHVFWQRDSETLFDRYPVIRPANYPSTYEQAPGDGYKIVRVDGKKILIINTMGRTSFGGLNHYLEDPFITTDRILEETKEENPDYILVDFHAEATSEKYAYAYYLDGRVTAVVGTHTHVPTCDNRKLPEGTLFVCDIGMSGILDSVIGVRKEIIIEQVLTARNKRFEWKKTGTKVFRSVLIDTKESTITRLDKEI